MYSNVNINGNKKTFLGRSTQCCVIGTDSLLSLKTDILVVGQR